MVKGAKVSKPNPLREHVSLFLAKIKFDKYGVSLVLILVVAFSIYIAAITPASFGYYHDDSIYVATAKSLATGQGYRIISLPGDPVQTKSPPLQPFLLSLIWRIFPDFPANLTVMMALTAVISIGALLMVWLYLTHYEYASKWQGVFIVAATAVNWRTIILATGIYVEMYYLIISIAGLYLAEKYMRNDNKIIGLGLGVVLGLSFLTRTSGITVLIAVLFYSLIRRRFFTFIYPLTIASLFVIVWVSWGYVNRPTSMGVNGAYYESYFQTLTTIVSDTQALTSQSKATILLSIISRNILTILIAVPLICLGLPFGWPQNYVSGFYYPILGLMLFTLFFIMLGFIRHLIIGIRLAHLYIILFIALHLIWPYSGYDRFLMPLLPFLILFLFIEFKALTQFIKSMKNRNLTTTVKLGIPIILIISILLLSFTGYNYGFGIYRSLTSLKGKNLDRAAEDYEAIQWIIDHTDPEDVLICYRDPVYYLYTGRKATRSSPLKDGGKTVGTSVNIEERVNIIYQIIEENKGKYLVLTSTDLELEVQADAYQKAYKEVLEKHPQVFIPVFRSHDARCVIYQIHNDS